jgi:TolA-binding protein
MKHSPNHPEDLLVLARRGGLSSRELEELEQGLRVSPTLKVADEVGRAFDRIAEVHEGDEQRIAGWVDRVIDRASSPAAHAPRLWRLGLIAAIVLGSASAMGYWGVRTLSQGSASKGTGVRTVESPRPGSSASAGKVRVRPRAGDDAAMPPAQASAEPGAGQGASPGSEPDPTSNASRDRLGRPRGPGASVATATSAAREATPAAVFAAANAARRAGSPDRAIALYLELQRNYPRSAEASLSYVSLGRLFLTRRQLPDALAQFTASLRGGGPLEEEALLGKAQTLAALGRRADEWAAWQTLLGHYPHSVYAAEAREHLGTERR